MRRRSSEPLRIERLALLGLHARMQPLRQLARGFEQMIERRGRRQRPGQHGEQTQAREALEVQRQRIEAYPGLLRLAALTAAPGRLPSG